MHTIHKTKQSTETFVNNLQHLFSDSKESTGILVFKKRYNDCNDNLPDIILPDLQNIIMEYINDTIEVKYNMFEQKAIKCVLININCTINFQEYKFKCVLNYARYRFKMRICINNNILKLIDNVFEYIQSNEMYSSRNMVRFFDTFTKCNNMKRFYDIKDDFCEKINNHKYVIYDWSGDQNMYIKINNMKMMRNLTVILSMIYNMARKHHTENIGPLRS